MFFFFFSGSFGVLKSDEVVVEKTHTHTQRTVPKGQILKTPENADVARPSDGRV